jgi:hypothetical protein
MEGQQNVAQSILEVLHSMQAATAQNVAFVQQLASQYQQQQPAVQPEQAGGNFFLKTANKVIPTLPQFRGNTNESVEFFIRECEEKFASYGIPVDGDNTNLAVHCATSRFPSTSNVHFWWLNHCIQVEQSTNTVRFANTCTWSYFKEALVAKYRSVDHPIRIRERLLKLRHQKESIEQFNNQFLILVNQVDMTFDEKFFFYANALKPNTAQHVRQRTYTSLDAVMSDAVLCEHAYRRRQQPDTRPPPPNPHSMSSCEDAAAATTGAAPITTATATARPEDTAAPHARPHLVAAIATIFTTASASARAAAAGTTGTAPATARPKK